jgi:two-component system sensor histidine kinase TctE
MIGSETSLFRRLVLLIGFVLTAIAVALVAAAWSWGRTAADETYDRLLIGAALQIAEAVAVEDDRLVLDMPISAFEMLALADRDRVFYRVIGVDGATITGAEDLDVGRDLDRAARGPLVTSRHYAGEPVRVAVVSRAVVDPRLAGRVKVLVAQTEIARESLAASLARRVVWLVLGLSLVGLIGAIVAIRVALAPLQRVAQVLRERDPNDLTALTVATPKELSPFADAINRFMERLAERIALLERFIADAAHQIRTPLTALTAQVDLLSRGDFEDRERDRIRRIQERADQLGRLTNQILSHAMIIHRTDTIAFVPVDLVAVARRALRDGVPISLPRDVVVALEAPEHEVMVAGEPVSLREAIANVVDNAIRHGAPGRLTVRVVEPDATTAIVEVEDDGPGIPPEAWSRVTTRFGGPSSGVDGTGLGFAIAAEVCEAHGGRLDFRAPGPEHGFTVILRFPKGGDRS